MGLLLGRGVFPRLTGLLNRARRALSGSEWNSTDWEQIGIIHTPFTEETGMPIQPTFSEATGTVEIDPAYSDGLLDIEGLSHLVLLYRFHRANGHDLRVQPFMEDETHGVFATRAPRRPTSIGMSVVKLETVDDGTLTVTGIDVIDGTPLLDVKPFVPEFDHVDSAEIGWLEDSISNTERGTADSRFVE